jgi:hypothetical protein
MSPWCRFSLSVTIGSVRSQMVGPKSCKVPTGGTDIPPYVNWECSNCQDSGLIRHWEVSPYDLRPGRRFDEPGLISIELTDDEHAQLRRLQLLDLDSERLVWSAYRDHSRLLLLGIDEDLDNLVGFVACEANHLEETRRQRRLDQVIGKLESALRAFG